MKYKVEGSWEMIIITHIYFYIYIYIGMSDCDAMT